VIRCVSVRVTSPPPSVVSDRAPPAGRPQAVASASASHGPRGGGRARDAGRLLAHVPGAAAPRAAASAASGGRGSRGPSAAARARPSPRTARRSCRSRAGARPGGTSRRPPRGARGPCGAGRRG
jgi:hypothetical protein